MSALLPIATADVDSQLNCDYARRPVRLAALAVSTSSIFGRELHERSVEQSLAVPFALSGWRAGRAKGENTMRFMTVRSRSLY